MRKRKLPSIRRLERESAEALPPIAYNPGTMTDPLPAVERAMAVFRRRVRGNPLAAYEKCRLVLADLREMAAEVFGGTPHGWALADGATGTIDRVGDSLAQLLGGRVQLVSSHHEHVGGLGAFAADPRYEVRQVAIEQIAQAPGQVFFLSHVTYDTNRDNSAEIRALAARPDRPIVVVDGCQAVGQIDVDVAALGCHAYVASAHKWLGGPHGTGLLYLSPEALGRWPSPFRAGEPLCPELPIGWWEPRGGQDFSRIAGVAAAIRAYQCHARPARPLRERFIQQLREALADRVEVMPSSAAEGRVVTFGLRELDVYPVYRRLTERGVAVKCIKKAAGADGGDGSLEVLRVGFPWWTDDGQVDEAVGILRTVVAELEADPHPVAA